MIFINEWLPNPTGVDTKAEFIELYNNGATLVSLSGWKLTTTGKKIFSLDGYSIAPREYLLLSRAKTKMSLKNSDEVLSLYDATGRLVDRSSFLGAASEGKSFSRINYTTDVTEHFIWSVPTPGAANKITLDNSVAANNYPIGAVLNPGDVTTGFAGTVRATGEMIFSTLAFSIILAAVVVYCLKSDANLSNAFFSRDD